MKKPAHTSKDEEQMASIGSRLEPDQGAQVQTRFWLQILNIHLDMFTKLNRALNKHASLSVAKFEVMAQLSRFPDGLSMGELSDHLKVTNGNVSGLANRLRADGLIEKTMSETDRRSFSVKLTPKGVTLFNKAAVIHSKELSVIFQNVTSPDLLSALDALRTVSVKQDQTDEN